MPDKLSSLTEFFRQWVEIFSPLNKSLQGSQWGADGRWKVPLGTLGKTDNPVDQLWLKTQRFWVQGDPLRSLNHSQTSLSPPCLHTCRPISLAKNLFLISPLLTPLSQRTQFKHQSWQHLPMPGFTTKSLLSPSHSPRSYISCYSSLIIPCIYFIIEDGNTECSFFSPLAYFPNCSIISLGTGQTLSVVGVTDTDLKSNPEK